MPVAVLSVVARFRQKESRFHILKLLLEQLSVVLFTLFGSTFSATRSQIVCPRLLRPLGSC